MVSSVYIRQQIESGNDVGAAAVSVVLLLASLALLAVVGLIQRWGGRHERSSPRAGVDGDADERRGFARGGCR